jgi:hypothetical protein
MPLLVADVQDRCARPMAGAVYQRVDPSPPLDRAIDEALEILT